MSEKREVVKRVAERHSPALVPPIDVLEDETGITLFADLPGVPLDGLTVRLDGDGLLIEGEVAVETPEGTTPAYTELQTPRFRRALTLSRELDTTKSDAAFKDGVLKLRIPKAEHAQPRRIQVNVG
ncbi:MAG: Hsp20/alpha crystallin family protein [Pseudomonadota bacterium]|nr:Hsp20/alpha crystallin family protein [Pseudomonadota bacterium]